MELVDIKFGVVFSPKLNRFGVLMRLVSVHTWVITIHYIFVSNRSVVLQMRFNFRSRWASLRTWYSSDTDIQSTCLSLYHSFSVIRMVAAWIVKVNKHKLFIEFEWLYTQPKNVSIESSAMNWRSLQIQYHHHHHRCLRSFSCFSRLSKSLYFGRIFVAMLCLSESHK